MEETIDTHLFIDIIVSEGAQFLSDESINGDVIEYYHGLNGRKIPICVSDEFITSNVAKGYLFQLGLASLIDRGLFD